MRFTLVSEARTLLRTVGHRTIIGTAKAKILKRPIPLHVIYEVTHRCNLSCEYCDRHTPLPNELSFEDASRIIDEFVRLGMVGMTLDGGEPLVRQDIDKMIDKLHSTGTQITINTNGILIPQKLDSVRKAMLIYVSLDGPEPYHDCMRGPGSYRRAIRGIRTARDAGIEVKLRCTLNRHNLASVPELVRLAEELQCQIAFQPALNSLFQNSKRNGSAWEPEVAEFRNVIRWLAEQKRNNQFIGNRYASLKHFLYYPNPKVPPCSAGWVHVTMDPEGFLYHCGQVSRIPQKINVLQFGVEEAFRKINRRGCDQCWCASLVDTNYIWGLQVSKFMPYGVEKVLKEVQKLEGVSPRPEALSSQLESQWSGISEGA